MTNKDSLNTALHPTDGTSTHIYGNDDSVYIIPELDNVSGNGVSNKVTAGVDGRYTGVQRVDIDVGYHAAGVKLAVGSDNTELYDSVYTVYNKNNYVIAAVIVGEAKWIVIESDTPRTSAYTGGIIKPTDPSKFPNVVKNGTDLDLHYHKTVPTNAEIQALISNAAGQNCTYNPLAGTATFGSSLLGTTYNVNLIEVFKVTTTGLDGKSTIQYLDDGTTAQVPGLTANTLYVKGNMPVIPNGSTAGWVFVGLRNLGD